MGRLDGKVAVITGATSGIGLRTAEIFVAEGAKIVIAGRRVPEGEALAKKLGANLHLPPDRCHGRRPDAALIALSVEKFGKIDCLFNNAGGPAQTGGIEGLEVDRFDAAMATLVRSVMLGMKHAAPYMKKQGSGSIINNGSIAGRLAGFSSSMVYGAAKAAVIHLTKCVAMELGESNIRVNSISPGAIATGIFGKALGLSVEAAEKTPAVMREVYKTAQPIPRAGLPEDIAHAAVFLASDESSFINGHDLVVDGAMTGGRNWTQQQQGYVALRKAFDQGEELRCIVTASLRGAKRHEAIHTSFVARWIASWPVIGLASQTDGAMTANKSEGETQMSAALHCRHRPGSSPVLSCRDRRPRLRLRDRQGAAVHDGCDFGRHRAALREQRSTRLDARYVVEPITSHALPNVPGKRVTIVRVFYGPGGFTRAHRHAGSVTAYITKGEIRSQLAGGPVETFKVGQSFFEPPGAVHLVSANASNTEPAELIAVFVADEGAQLTTLVE